MGVHRDRSLATGLALTFFALVLLFSFHEADEDLWGRMASGRLVLEEGSVPEKDVFAYVPTKPLWVDHEWLAGVVFQEGHSRMGDAALLFLRMGLGVGAIALAIRASSTTSAWSPPLLAMALWPLFAIGFNSVLRAQAFTFLFLAATWLLLERGGRALLWLLPLTALWANLHGGFVLGPLLVLAYAAESALRRQTGPALRLAALSLASFGVSLLNPYGLAYWTYLADALTMPRPEIVEWQRAAPADFPVYAALVLSLLLVGVKRPRPAHLIALSGAAVGAVLHLRFAPLLAIAMVITLSPSLPAVFASRARGRPLVALLVMLLGQGLFFTGLAVSWYRRDLSLAVRVLPDRYPVAAVERLREEPSGNVAVFFNWGEFVLYHLYPHLRVSIDGRYETVYPEPVVRANWDFTRGVAGSESFLDDDPADYALYPRGSGAARLLEGLSDWEALAEDDFFVMYRRR